MQKYMLHSAKALFVASLISSPVYPSSFTLDDVLDEMSHAVQKMQKKFSKMHSSLSSGMHSMLHGGFSKGNILSTKVNDADLVITIVQELDKDSIKAVVHHDVLNITAHNKEVELELGVDRKAGMMKVNVQHRVEKAENAKDKDGAMQKQVSYSSQQVMQSLPVEINLDDVVVEYENNILTIKLSRVAPVVSPKVINVIKK